MYQNNVITWWLRTLFNRKQNHCISKSIIQKRNNLHMTWSSKKNNLHGRKNPQRINLWDTALGQKTFICEGQNSTFIVSKPERFDPLSANPFGIKGGPKILEGAGLWTPMMPWQQINWLVSIWEQHWHLMG